MATDTSTGVLHQAEAHMKIREVWTMDAQDMQDVSLKWEWTFSTYFHDDYFLERQCLMGTERISGAISIS